MDFSRLDRLFSSRPRHAENLESRPDIRRGEADDHRRQGRRENETEEEEPAWEDNTFVSAQALRTFLEGFLSGTVAGAPPSGPVVHDAPFPVVSSAPPPPQAHVAAQAYQSAQRRQSPPQASSPPVKEPSGITTEEERRIHRLIAQLAVLESRGVTQLHIQKAGTFLEALEAAVHNASL